MTRQTKKYTAACKTLGLPSTAHLPHAAVYGMLTLRGYTWSGEQWLREVPKDILTASIRVTAHEDTIIPLALAIQQLIEENGAMVHSVKGPYQSKKSSKFLLYINFSHPRTWK